MQLTGGSRADQHLLQFGRGFTISCRICFVALHTPKVPHAACVAAAAPAAYFVCRYGVGMQLDLVAPSPGGVVMLRNVVVVRPVCIKQNNEPGDVALQPRLPGELLAATTDSCGLLTVCVGAVVVL